MFNSFLLNIFEKYAELLKRRFSDDFAEVGTDEALAWAILITWQIVSTDDYMPMPIDNAEQFDKVISVSWYTPEKPREELKYASEGSLVRLATDLIQLSTCPTVFSNVSPLLH